MIVKTKFLCKCGCSSIGSIGTTHSNECNDLFIKGKWYDAEYLTWSDQLYKLNGGWRTYWVVNELGVKKEITRQQASVLFEFDIDKLRDFKIKKILDNGSK